jgi:hypothetical protein
MVAAGYVVLGDGWWGDQLSGGMCTVALLDLATVADPGLNIAAAV